MNFFLNKANIFPYEIAKGQHTYTPLFPSPPVSAPAGYPVKSVCTFQIFFFLRTLPTLPREIVPPQKPVFCPDGQFQGRGGTISRESQGQPLLSLLHTKTATPLQYEKLSPLFAVRDIVPPSLFPPGGTISRGSEGGTISRGRVGTL